MSNKSMTMEEAIEVACVAMWSKSLTGDKNSAKWNQARKMIGHGDAPRQKKSEASCYKCSKCGALYLKCAQCPECGECLCSTEVVIAIKTWTEHHELKIVKVKSEPTFEEIANE